MVAQFGLRGRQFGLLELKQSFRREPCAAFFSKFIGQTHGKIIQLFRAESWREQREYWLKTRATGRRVAMPNGP